VQVGAAIEMAAHVLRARRTAAGARGATALGAIVLLISDGGLAKTPALAIAGFAIILVTAVVQLVAPRLGWLQIEESVSPLAGILIIGLGDERVNVLSVLWLGAVASGVLARGGRVHSIGRTLLLSALAMPIVLHLHLGLAHLGLCIAAISLLLTCGRVTVELNHLLTQARHDADHDGLTGVLSRSRFRALLDELGAAAEAPGIGLVLVDLDGFGQVNKMHGHAAGDALLISSAERIRTVVGEAPVGRLGGDEFAAIVPAESAEDVAVRTVAALAEPFGPIRIDASVGVANAPRDGHDADALLRAADVALRVAKGSGRGQLSVYAGESFGDGGPTGARGALERLIEGHGIEMVAQPIVDSRTGYTHAFEALARFRTRGTSSPLHWFALADEFGMREELELACLRAALELFPSRPAGTLMSVNLSGPVLLEAPAQAMLAAQPDIDGLIVEVTEQALVESDADLSAAVGPLLARGARIAVDDMGAGYSGLRQITALRPAYLKLDRSLVSGIDTDPDRAALLSALLGYARHTGGQIVAEGVETAEERAAIASMGIPLIQGYFFSKPGPPWPVPAGVEPVAVAFEDLPLQAPSRAAQPD
jgi:diguanylate cyclase (GGDEF)-like protein